MHNWVITSSASSSVGGTWLLLLLLALMALLLLLLLMLVLLLLLLMEALSCSAWAMMSSKSSGSGPLPFLDLPGIISTRSSCGEEMKC
jgi:hypothetical protein